MSRKLKSKFVFIGFVFAFLMICSPSFLRSENITKGNIIGFVYDRDGTTPLEGALVKLFNISNGEAYESSQSNSYGVFKIEGIERGIYIYGVKTAKGDFNSDGLFGVRIHGNETAKLSISLAPYEEKLASAIREVYEEQKEAGEAFVGQVVNYIPDTRIAEVFIKKGLLQLDDRIYAKGEITDFYQDVNYLEFEGNSVDNLFAGQTGFMGVENKVKTGDLIYTVFKKGILPLLSSPLGSASIIAGSSEIIHSPIEMKDACICPSPWKPPWWRRWWWYGFCKKYPWHPWCKSFNK